jgi:hypothetical protein
MAPCFHADPYVTVRRRDGKARNALQFLDSRERAVLARQIAKAFARTPAADAGLGVGDIDEASFVSHLRRLGGDTR